MRARARQATQDVARRVASLEARVRPQGTTSAIPGTSSSAIRAGFDFGAGWTDYDGGATYGVARVFKTADGIVHLEGLVKRTSGVGTTILQLPGGFRPQYQAVFLAVADPSTPGRVEVTSAGAVVLTAGGVGVVALDGISFRAA